MNAKEKDGKAFNIEGLPTEIKHLILKKLKTKYLEEVCARVSREWEGMIGDILEQRRMNVAGTTMITPLLKSEMSLRNPEQVLQDPLEMLKVYESTMLEEKFDALSLEVNSDVTHSKKGFLYKLWRLRDCDCGEFSECLVRRVHLMPAFNLMVVDCDSSHGGLHFYNLLDIERLKEDPNKILKYDCPNVAEWVGRNHLTNTGISVFRDHIVVEVAAKTILMLKVVSVDHEACLVNLERVRIIHLPLWASALCLFEDRLTVLYTTGHVGMWDRTRDELFISTERCDLGEIKVFWMHRIKLYRIGSLALVKANASGVGALRWYVVDPNDTNLVVRQVDMPKLIDSGFLMDRYNCCALEVFHVDIWYNCFVAHLSVRGLDSQNGKFFVLVFKRINRYPSIEDFFDRDKFRNEVFSGETETHLTSVKVKHRISIAFTSPFIPTIKYQPRQLDPEVDKPVPVADVVAAHLSPLNRSLARNVLKAFRIRLANLPFGRCPRSDGISLGQA